MSKKNITCVGPVGYASGFRASMSIVDEFHDISRTKMFSVPYKDIIGPFSIIPKDVLLKSYTDSIGKNIDFIRESRIVKSVKVIDGNICIELE